MSRAVSEPLPPALAGAPVLYFVHAWVRPDGGERYLAWLEQKHMTEVVREPGFLWARRVALEQADAQGWRGYLLIYGLASRAALEADLQSPARERFWRELVPLDDVHRAERTWGTVDFAPVAPIEAEQATKRLEALISQISEDRWCAGWLTDIEHLLWDDAAGTEPRHCTADEPAELRLLSERCGGWVAWESVAAEPRRIPMPDWLDRHAAWTARR